MHKLLLVLLSVFISNNKSFAEDKINLLHFGLTEKITFQKNQEGPNFTISPSWNPGYSLSSDLRLKGLFGITNMKSNRGHFTAFQVMGGIALPNLNVVNIYPEALVGLEHWDIADKKSRANAALNFHLPINTLIQNSPINQNFDTLILGYSAIFIPAKIAHQINLGLRFNFESI